MICLGVVGERPPLGHFAVFDMHYLSCPVRDLLFNCFDVRLDETDDVFIVSD